MSFQVKCKLCDVIHILDSDSWSEEVINDFYCALNGENCKKTIGKFDDNWAREINKIYKSFGLRPVFSDLE